MAIYSYEDFKHYSSDAFMRFDNNGNQNGTVSLGEYKQDGGADFLKSDELKERAYSIFEKYAGDDKEMDKTEYEKFLSSTEYKAVLNDYKVEEGVRARDLKDKNGVSGLSDSDIDIAEKDNDYNNYCKNILKSADEEGTKDGKTTVQEIIDSEFSFLDDYPSEYKSRMITSLRKYAAQDGNDHVSVKEFIKWTNSKEFLNVMNDIKIKDAEKIKEAKDAKKDSKTATSTNTSSTGWFNWNPFGDMNFGGGFTFPSIMGNNYTAMMGMQSDWSWLDGLYGSLTNFGAGAGFNFFA